MRYKLVLGFIAALLIGVVVFLSLCHHQQEQAPLDQICNPFSPKVSKEDGERIQTLISTIAHSSYTSLLFKQGDLRRIGDTLDRNLAPFVFLGYIFSDPQLTQDMKLIQKSSMKYDNFVKGVQKNLVQVYREGCLYQIAKGFSAHIHRDPEAINQILKQAIESAEGGNNSKAFRIFIDYLIKTS